MKTKGTINRQLISVESKIQIQKSTNEKQLTDQQRKRIKQKLKEPCVFILSEDQPIVKRLYSTFTSEEDRTFYDADKVILFTDSAQKRITYEQMHKLKDAGKDIYKLIR